VKVSPKQWCVTWNGTILFRGFTSWAEAAKKAEKWQGSYAEHRGLMKHGDKADHIEVKRDLAMEKEFDERADVARRGHPQKVTVILGEG